MVRDPSTTKRVSACFLSFYTVKSLTKANKKKKGKSLINNSLLESSICIYCITLSNNLLLFIIFSCCHSSNITTISIPFHNPYSSNIYLSNTLQELNSCTFNAGFVLIRHSKKICMFSITFRQFAEQDVVVYS